MAQPSKLVTSNSPRSRLNVHAWAWDITGDPSGLVFDDENRSVLFHPAYSSGTVAVRGNTPFVGGHDYYWEIEILTPLYGTDVMIGVGTSKAILNNNKHTFCSLLGLDKDSWGYSYNGTLQHNGKWQSYGPGFNNASTVGIHLNTWNRTLSYFVDGRPLGVAFHLNGQVLYPMVSSTAASSALRLIYSYSCPSSLQLLSLRALNASSKMMDIVSSIPGLQALAVKTSLAYKNSVKTGIVQNQEIQHDVYNNQCRPNYIILDNDETVEEFVMPRRRKRKFTINLPSSPAEIVNGLADATADSSCKQCGTKLRPRVQLTGTRVTTLPPPRLPIPRANSLCVVCSIIM